MAEIDPDKWYPLDKFVRAFQRIGAEFGDYTLRQVGVHIPKTAAYLPSYKDLATALSSMDAGYHYNHGKDNQPLFNPQTGEIKEGIGHMVAKPVAGKKLILMECDTLYPCAFDEGIVTGLAQRFEPTATVAHDPKSCRKRGSDRCVYNVTWK